MSSIKQLIVNAIIKVSGENPTLNREGEPTMEQARDDFIKLLLAELFPEDPAVPVATPKKAKKTKAKKTEEVVVVKSDDVPPPLEKVPDVETEVKAETPKKTKKTKKTEAPAAPVEVVTEAPAAEPAAESPGKKKRAPMTEEAKAAMKAKREATLAAKKAAVAPEPTSNAAAGAGGQQLEEGEVIPTPPKEKKPRKPKAEKPAEGSNLASIDPTWRKHLKKADKDHAKELEPELLKYLNALTNVDFNAKKAEEHVADFIASRVTKAVEAADDKVEADLDVVEFNGKEYFVNPETKRVYEGEGTCDAEGNWTNYKGVGYVGMAAFAEMTIDE